MAAAATWQEKQTERFVGAEEATQAKEVEHLAPLCREGARRDFGGQGRQGGDGEPPPPSSSDDGQRRDLLPCLHLGNVDSHSHRLGLFGTKIKR